MKHAHTSKKPGQRPTIGYLARGIGGDVGQALWAGLVDAARERDVNSICFIGDRLRDPKGFSSPANLVYELANTGSIDGLVSWASAVGGALAHEETVSFHHHYRPLPIVSIALPMEGVPTVLIENYVGMYDAIAHLIEVHGYRRLAFIRGPENHYYAQERYRAYTAALEAHGIPFDPKLVTPPADFAASTGVRGIQRLVDEQKLRPHVDLDAVVTASDLFALTALEELQVRGIKVPDDVALVGFNDAVEGRVATPPLTTVRPPFYEIGRRATEALLDLLEGEQVPEQIVLPSELVVRRSCGCKSLAVMQAARSPDAREATKVNRKKSRATLATQREEILTEMTQAITATELDILWAEQLLDSFVEELEGKSTGVFLAALDIILHLTMTTGGNMPAWQGALSALRRSTLSHLDDEARARAEDLWQQARVMIAEATEQAQTAQALHAEQQAEVLRQVGQELLTTFDVQGLMDVFEDGLPRLEIPSVYLSLYEDPEKPTEWSRLMLAYSETGRVELNVDGVRFPSPQLVPDGMWPDRQYSYVVEPLYFQEDQLGFILCEVGPREGAVYEMLRVQISNALQGALLMQRVKERSAELARQQYILDTFMESVPDRIYFKDLESRITRANRAHATSLGLSNPTEEIGKGDFDFFPEEQARVKYEQEQEIIRTGQPLLDLEESDGMGHWALTTKMPLRDENGEIIGTFGISRDITEIKRAQAELVRQERLSALGQLTATVAHEIRNPLGTVRTCVFAIGDAIEQKQLERVERALQLAERNIVRCDTIISELLDFTRGGALQRRSTNLDVWLNSVLDEMLDQGTIPQGITCIRELNANIEVSTDTEHLHRALINVVSNAVDAMQECGENGSRLTISTHVVDERVEIAIRDTGCGISDAVRDKLFEPLFSTKSFGIGLGLPIVKGIMEQHGGGIEISSRANEGATVVLWLPIAKNEGD